MRYDAIVIGAGSAGSVLAVRLSEDPGRSVLLLEAGPDYPNFEHLPDDLKLGNNVWLSAYGPHNWGYVATVTPQQTNLTIPRGKATGGSSAINGQVLYRGIPESTGTGRPGGMMSGPSARSCRTSATTALSRLPLTTSACAKPLAWLSAWAQIRLSKTSLSNGSRRPMLTWPQLGR